MLRLIVVVHSLLVTVAAFLFVRAMGPVWIPALLLLLGASVLIGGMIISRRDSPPPPPLRSLAYIYAAILASHVLAFGVDVLRGEPNPVAKIESWTTAYIVVGSLIALLLVGEGLWKRKHSTK